MVNVRGWWEMIPSPAPQPARRVMNHGKEQMATCKKCLVIGAASMALAIGCGAFGAHALKSILQEGVKAGELTESESLDTSHGWDVAVRNHGIHSLGLVFLGLAWPEHFLADLAWPGFRSGQVFLDWPGRLR